MKRYRVTCNNCKGSAELTIDDSSPLKPQVVYHQHTPIIASRFRGDGQWGFECQCGNDSRVAFSEKDQIEVLVQNMDKTRLKAMAKGLEKKAGSRFTMRAV